MRAARIPLAPLEGIAFGPTPLHRLSRLSAELDAEVWIKRDDLTGLALGGNKARKLAYLAAEALDKGCDNLITAGAAQSNHARMTAAAAAILGFGCHLVLAGPEDATGNALLDRLFGAEIHWAPGSDWKLLSDMITEVSEGISSRGGRPLEIPLGGATPVGCFGYADAMREISKQSNDAGVSFAKIVFASGTGGTHAGLLAGGELADASPLELHAIAVAQPDALPKIVASLANRTADACGAKASWSAEKIFVDARYWGGTYGEATRGGLDAIGLFATLEGILLDPVYSGKAAHGLIDMLRNGEIDRKEPVLFLHTGGAQALFSTAFSESVAAITAEA